MTPYTSVDCSVSIKKSKWVKKWNMCDNINHYLYYYIIQYISI